MSTVGNIAKTEKVTNLFVSWTMRLAYLSSDVLERLVVTREPPALSRRRDLSTMGNAV